MTVKRTTKQTSRDAISQIKVGHSVIQPVNSKKATITNNSNKVLIRSLNHFELTVPDLEYCNKFILDQGKMELIVTKVVNVTVMASLSAYSVTEPLGLTLGSQCALQTV